MKATNEAAIRGALSRVVEIGDAAEATTRVGLGHGSLTSRRAVKAWGSLIHAAFVVVPVPRIDPGPPIPVSVARGRVRKAIERTRCGSCSVCKAATSLLVELDAAIDNR